jgi:serine/threonine protein kinase
MDSEKEGFPITALREIRLLKQMNHPNIVQLKEIVTSRGENQTNVYLVFEYCEHDLEGLLNMRFAQPDPSIEAVGQNKRIEYTIP